VIRLNPYLKFNGNCREAMTFYHECLGGELELQAVMDSPAAKHMPADAQNQIMHATLEREGISIMASDMVNKQAYSQGTSIDLCINGDSPEITSFFDKLAQGGRIDKPLREEFFGTFGSLTDKFGVQWMVQIDKPKT
jgi:PhnB protein